MKTIGAEVRMRPGDFQRMWRHIRKGARPSRDWIRREVIGVLNLFSESEGGMNAPDLAAAQALAEVATIGILQERAIHHAEAARHQLQTALKSRVVIEQAKGVDSENLRIDVASRGLRVVS